MTTSVQPISFAGASIVIQVFLLLISYVALVILSKSQSARNMAKESYSILIFWLLIALLFILFSEDLYTTWGATLGDLTLPTIPRSLSFLAVFVLDIIFITILILRTGGTKKSPFTSVLLLLPTLAIFLNEPRWRFLMYSFICGAIYAVVLRRSFSSVIEYSNRSSFYESARKDEQAEDWSVRWTNLSCLALATLIGFITAPKQ